MLHFECDYTEGAHAKIIERLTETNMVQCSGYGEDEYCTSAKEKIRLACKCPDAQVYLLTGGTQTNATIIDSMLAGYEGVVAATTGHIAVHEAGAIEAGGHKVLTIPGHEGKIDAGELKSYLKIFWADDSHEHMVIPGMVYVSHPTEYGTLYSDQELSEISAVCKEYNIPLFLDGARLGYGIMSKKADLTLEKIAEYTDVFYIGGTKVGALCGEAVVFTRHNQPPHFTGTVKRHGALLAKGRLLGVQFDTLFTDDLYFKISQNAIEMAEKVKEGFLSRGFQLLIDSPTNQQFVIIEKKLADQIGNKVRYTFWEPVDEERIAVRFASSWATTEEQVRELFEIIDEALA